MHARHGLLTYTVEAASLDLVTHLQRQGSEAALELSAVESCTLNIAAIGADALLVHG